MTATNASREPAALAALTQQARRAYVDLLAGGAESAPWWTAVVITASSQRQAGRYRTEIQRRKEQETLPPGVPFLVVPDIGDRRIGSGGATINALRQLAEETALASKAESLEEWWRGQRVLIIHSGGDARRLPEYSLAGKLFGMLPVRTPWGETSTVFDETMALSTLWARSCPSGFVVASGDVLLTFPSDQLAWDRAGVCGVAMLQPAEVGTRHGVYVTGDGGRVYAFLQKPSLAEIRAAGGLLAGERVALDIGLLHFDPASASALTELSGITVKEGSWRRDCGILDSPSEKLPSIDIYQQMTLSLTGQWTPAPDAHWALRSVHEALRGRPFWCSLVEGDFTHIGTTAHFRDLMLDGGEFAKLFEAHQRAGAETPPGVRSKGVIVDSVLCCGAELAPGAIALECCLDKPARLARGAIAHGLTGIPAAVELPEDVVAHQAPVSRDDGLRGVVIRVYGVADNPKAAATESTWLGRPMMETLQELGLDAELVWPDIPAADRLLWNAELFPVASAEEAWRCARWMMGYESSFSAANWRRLPRMSLASSAHWVDAGALAEQRSRRRRAQWRQTAVDLADSGGDVRALLARSPGLAALSETGNAIRERAAQLEASEVTEAASRHYQAGLFFAQAGMELQAEEARAAAFVCVKKAVDLGAGTTAERLDIEEWRQAGVRVSAPARIDLGGGWSDTPPFCLDWGGSVLNIAITVEDSYPIATTVRRLDEPVVRCLSAPGEPVFEFRTNDQILAPCQPGSFDTIHRAALRMTGIVAPAEPLARRLERLGGGIEIRTDVNLPVGSGLGTSSILAATMLRALAEMAGLRVPDERLSDLVMQLEQQMSTGGGWQDQAGGIFPGAKLVTSGPGLKQRLRVQPVAWSRERQEEFARHFLVYYTGIRRVAKNLLGQVVGRYLAREVATVQVLHSIKTLAVEMGYALQEGDWPYLGRLLDRHWRLNQVLDPHTTNAPIEAVLQEIQPWLAGAKLAGAGGGGFLLLLARGDDEAQRMRECLGRCAASPGGRLYRYGIAAEGLQVHPGAAG